MRKLTSIGLLFLAIVAAAQTSRPVVWKVNGVVGGNVQVGTITQTGMYTAPLTVPNPATVTVSVTSLEDITKSANATVTIVEPPAPPIVVTIAPTSATVETGKSLAFTQQVVGGKVQGGNVNTGGGVGMAGIDMTTAGSREVFVPGLYEVGTFAHRLSTASCTTTPGIPAVGVTFYEPCFGNATGAVETHPATTVYDAFNVQLMILKVGIPNDADTCLRWDSPTYSTREHVNEVNAYIAIATTGNSVDILHFTGALTGQRAVTYSCGTIASSNAAFRWMLGVHKNKLFYQSGNDVRIFNVPTQKWCASLSADGLSDDCNSSTAIAYHASPVASTWSIGGNEGDIVPGNYIPLTRTSPSPAEIFVYNIVAKTTVQMASVPTGTFDWGQVSDDGAKVLARIAGANYAWNAVTGAILNGGTTVGGAGHSGFGIKPDGTPVHISFRDGTPESDNGTCNNGSFGPQRKAFHPFDSASFTSFLQHPSARDPQTSCSDSHWSAHQNYPNPGHFLVAFDLKGDNQQIDVAAGALSADWDNDWRYLTEEIVVCDYSNIGVDIVNAPKCWRVAHTRQYEDAKDCNACVNITRDGRYLVWRSKLGADESSAANKRVYIMRAGPLF